MSSLFILSYCNRLLHDINRATGTTITSMAWGLAAFLCIIPTAIVFLFYIYYAIKVLIKRNRQEKIGMGW
jgi:hypothetical protein